MEGEEWEDTVLSLLMRMTHVYFQKSFQQLNSIGLHPGQPPMLWHIFKDEGLSQKELASRLKVKPPTVNVSLQRDVLKWHCICPRRIAGQPFQIRQGGKRLNLVNITTVNR